MLGILSRRYHYLSRRLTYQQREKLTASWCGTTTTAVALSCICIIGYIGTPTSQIDQTSLNQEVYYDTSDREKNTVLDLRPANVSLFATSPSLSSLALFKSLRWEWGDYLVLLFNNIIQQQQWRAITRCDDDHYFPIDVHDHHNIDEDIEDESGYTEAVRFFECLEYHRALLFDYNRRWGPLTTTKDDDDNNNNDENNSSEDKKKQQKRRRTKSTNDDKVNVSATWPRNIPLAKDVHSLEIDLSFCQRSPSYRNMMRKCQDIQFRLASYYVQSINNENDQRKGFKMVKELAEHGHPDGMCYYAMILNDGELPGVDANPRQAVVWWRRCVDYHRHIQGTYELATAYYLGEGVPENAEFAVKLFRQAANLGHAGAAYMLGECLLDGVGVVRDRADALDWLVTAAELGHILARKRVMTVLNENYNNLDSGTTSSQKEAVKWIEDSKVKAVNIERRYTIGGGSRNPAIKARRQTKVAESRDEDDKL